MGDKAVNLNEKFASFSDQWSPKIVAQLNDYDILVAKVEGEFNWHNHPDTDEMFMVIDGEITIEMKDGDVALGPGELYVVPKGKEHRPVAKGEAKILLIEPQGVPNTGDPATAAEKELI